MTVSEYILNYDPGIPMIWMAGTYLLVGCVVVGLFMYGGTTDEIVRNCSWAWLAGYVFLVLSSTVLCRETMTTAEYNLQPFKYV